MGAPKGPRLPPQEHIDEEGVFIVFPGKSCTVCAVALTSRNRHGTSRLCVPHGREKDAARHRLQGKPPSQRTTRLRTKTDPTQTTAPDATPEVRPLCYPPLEQRRLQSLFHAFLNHPTLDDSSAILVSAMNEYELMARLRQVIPA